MNESGFWTKVQKTNACWTWLGSRNKRGYGYAYFDGRTHLAHRLSWNLSGGRQLRTLYLLHTCDNPPCVRPDHLRPGTQLDNMRDMIAKGRANLAGRSKLSASNVREIRLRLERGEPGTRIALDYDVSKFAVYAIKDGETYTYVR